MALAVGTNSYISVEDAATYFLDLLNAEAWTTATPERQAAALVTATRTIERQKIIGQKSDPAQALAFPRTYPGRGTAPLGVISLGWIVESVISQAVKDACCEQALYLLGQSAWDRDRENLKAAGVKSTSVGSASETFGTQNPNYLAPKAKELLRKYLVKVGRLV